MIYPFRSRRCARRVRLRSLFVTVAACSVIFASVRMVALNKGKRHWSKLCTEVAANPCDLEKKIEAYSIGVGRGCIVFPGRDYLSQEFHKNSREYLSRLGQTEPREFLNCVRQYNSRKFMIGDSSDVQGDSFAVDISRVSRGIISKAAAAIAVEREKGIASPDDETAKLNMLIGDLVSLKHELPKLVWPERYNVASSNHVSWEEITSGAKFPLNNLRIALAPIIASDAKTIEQETAGARTLRKSTVDAYTKRLGTLYRLVDLPDVQELRCD